MTDSNNSMPKIGQSVHEIPVTSPNRGKYADLWRQAVELSDGEWLPVEFADNRAAAHFQTGCYRRAKGRGLVMHKRGLIVYVGKAVPA